MICKRLYLGTWKQGWSRAQKKVVLGDGAEWIWNLTDRHFPGAIQIVDLYHARQHLWDLVRKLHPNDEPKQKRWMLVHLPLLDNGKMNQLTVALRSCSTTNAEVAEKIAWRPITFTITPGVCVTPNSAACICSSAPA